MRFKYLHTEISVSGNVKVEVRERPRTTSKTGCLNDTIWRYKNIGIETKSIIYKAMVRPTMTYTAETQREKFKNSIL